MPEEPNMSPERLEGLYRSLRSPLHSFLQRRVRDPEAAEDLLHDIFVRIHDGVAHLRRGDRLEPWIWSIARNALIDRARAERPRQSIEDIQEQETAADVAPDPRELRPLQRAVRAFLDHLPEPYREALILADLEGVPQTELARRLGLSHSGAKSRVQRARTKMANLFQQCCHLELDRYGNIVDYRPRGPECPGCDPC